jgi:hypothetical protein
MLTIHDVLHFPIGKGPGRTQVQLAQAIYGSKAKGYQQRVNDDCRRLVDGRKAERRGNGGVADPYRYYPVRNA